MHYWGAEQIGEHRKWFEWLRQRLCWLPPAEDLPTQENPFFRSASHTAGPAAVDQRTVRR